MADKEDCIDVYGVHHEWLVNHDTNHALTIPGHWVKSYIAKGSIYVHSGFMVNVYIGKESVMQEILYHRPKTLVDYAPISPSVFHTLFPNKDRMCGEDWDKFVEFVEMDGRLLFKFKRSDWNKHTWGVNLDNIEDTFAGQILWKLGPTLTYANLHPETIKTLKDCARLWNAIRAISNMNWKRDGFYDNEIQTIRNKMAEQAKEIAKADERFDNTCNGAADAMDTLSEKFGITVTL